MIKFLFTGVGLLLVLSLGEAVLHQQITFYLDFNNTGTFVGFESNQPDLRNWDFFLPNAKSFCATGWWKLHQFENYTPSTEGENYWISAWDTPSCRNVSHSSILNYHGSLRHFGPQDLDSTSVSIYSNTSHNGEEIIVQRPATADVPFVIESLFTTGYSNWTFFTGSDFDGNSTCLSSTERIHEIQSVIDEGVRFAKSILKGCDLRRAHHRNIDMTSFSV